MSKNLHFCTSACEVKVAAITDIALVDILECLDDKLAEQLLPVID